MNFDLNLEIQTLVTTKDESTSCNFVREKYAGPLFTSSPLSTPGKVMTDADASVSMYEPDDTHSTTVMETSCDIDKLKKKLKYLFIS
jgi:hypothetical protein